ncbi:hypothetical protein, partial [Microbacterium sp. K19]|uniref:hypothetical protein n=1 Tax=Microbacterium sp. K19 TaxID=2305449 RepID=UPI001F0F969A
MPSIGGTGVYALTTSGTSVYAGGLFTQANGTARKNLTAFDASDGVLLPWAPTTDLQVDAMVMDPAGADTIIKLIDLTTLEGADTPGKVRS